MFSPILPGTILRVHTWRAPNAWHATVDYVAGVEYEHLAGLAGAALRRVTGDPDQGAPAFVVGASGALYSDDDMAGVDLRHITFREALPAPCPTCGDSRAWCDR